MKILAGADSEFNMNETDNHYTSNAKKNQIGLPGSVPEEI
jgi:hypothetical protein